MDFKDWNSRLLAHFFQPDKAGRRVHLCVTEDLLKELGGDDALADFLAAVKGPDCNLGCATKVCYSALHLAEEWEKSGKTSPPPFLPYLAMFVLAAGRESPEGYRGFHKRLHELLGEEPENTPVHGFYKSWVLWEHLDGWSKNEAGGHLGIFHYKFGEKKNSGFVSIPLSQIVMLPAERAKLPELFAMADLDPANPPSDLELAELINKYGAKCGLRPRTLKALDSSGTNEEFRILLIESLLDELQDWQPYDDDIEADTSPGRGHILINLLVELVSGAAQPIFRVYNDGRFPEGDLTLINNSKAYFLRMPPVGWTTEIQASGGEKLPSFSWEHKTIFTSSTGLTFTLGASNFRIFEKGQRRGLDHYLETRRLNTGGKFLVAATDKSNDLVEWGMSSCPGWRELSVSGLPVGWKLFSADSAANISKIAKRYPAFAIPLACRIRLVGGLKLGRSVAYLEGYPPRVEIEAPDQEHTVELNGKEIAKCQGCTTVTLGPEFLDENNKISIYPTLSPDEGGRSQKFSLKKPEKLTNPGQSLQIPYSSMQVTVAGARVCAVGAIPPYPLQEDFADRRFLLIGQQIGQLADSSDWNDLGWAPVWLLEKGRKHLRLQFCGTNAKTCIPTSPPFQKELQAARKVWKRELYAHRRDIMPLGNKSLAQLWKLYLEACNS